MLGGVEIYYFAAARAAAGTDREVVQDASGTLGELLSTLAASHAGTTDAGMSLEEVFERCTFLIDGRNSPRETSLLGASRVDVLPPFAGG